MSFPGANAKMEMRKKTPNAQRPTLNAQFRDAFTLIELLVVISIIIVLMGLLFPAFRGVQDQAKKTQAKNDLTQIVTAVNAYYTEYGKYPLTPAAPGDTNYGAGVTSDKLFNELRNQGATENLRGIVFISPPNVKDVSSPRSGIGSDGQYYDPWGPTSGKAGSGVYHIRIDSDYDNQVDNPYTANTGAGPDKIRQGVAAWSLGKDGAEGATDFKASDDVISWQ
jgi:general secretion pathway protein G